MTESLALGAAGVALLGLSAAVDSAIATLIGALATAVLLAAAYYFPRGSHRRDAVDDDAPEDPPRHATPADRVE